MRNQRGEGLVSVLFWILILVLFAGVALKLVSPYMEYYKVVGVAERTVASNGMDTPERKIREDFRKRAEIDDVSFANDIIEISKNTGALVISFEYEKEIELTKHASLHIQFKGEAR